MSAAREEILSRIQAGLRGVPDDERPSDIAVARDYAQSGTLAKHALLELLQQRLVDYGATVRRVAADAAAKSIAGICDEFGVSRLAVPPGLAAAWRPDGVELVEDRGQGAAELDSIGAALTGCAIAVAGTGTLILDGHGACGRRLLTLMPDIHICGVAADQVVETVPEGLARVAGAARRGQPLTLISGPSASSDIELTRIEGVHGPRTLIVLLVAEA